MFASASLDSKLRRVSRISSHMAGSSSMRSLPSGQRRRVQQRGEYSTGLSLELSAENLERAGRGSQDISFFDDAPYDPFGVLCECVKRLDVAQHHELSDVPQQPRGVADSLSLPHGLRLERGARPSTQLGARAAEPSDGFDLGPAQKAELVVSLVPVAGQVRPTGESLRAGAPVFRDAGSQ